MRRIRIAALALAFVSMALGCGAYRKQDEAEMAKKGGLDPVAIEKIDVLCQGIVDDGFAPGAVLLIGRGDQVLMKKTYGNRFTDRGTESMTFDTLFDLASVTKATCTASAVMLLVQDGKIDLNAPVTRYVPEFRGKDKDGITILQLLTHISGLPAYTSRAKLEEEFGSAPNPDGLIQGIANLKLQSEPGTKYTYSCLNYLTLARVAQNVSGMNMDALLGQRMWGPLGMKDATFYPTPEQIARTAPTINDGKEFRRGMVHDPLANYGVSPSYAPGNAGGYMTVDDMSRYCRMILAGGKLKGRTIFTPAIWEKITTNQITDSKVDTARSCGWGVWSENAYASSLNQTPETCCLGHTGYTGTIVWMDKLSKAYVILFTNCVYPVDTKEAKDGVIKARRQVISTVVDNLDIYREVRKK